MAFPIRRSAVLDEEQARRSCRDGLRDTALHGASREPGGRSSAIVRRRPLRRDGCARRDVQAPGLADELSGLLRRHYGEQERRRSARADARAAVEHDLRARRGFQRLSKTCGPRWRRPARTRRPPQARARRVCARPARTLLREIRQPARSGAASARIRKEAIAAAKEAFEALLDADAGRARRGAWPARSGSVWPVHAAQRHRELKSRRSAPRLDDLTRLCTTCWPYSDDSARRWSGSGGSPAVDESRTPAGRRSDLRAARRRPAGDRGGHRSSRSTQSAGGRRSPRSPSADGCSRAARSGWSSRVAALASGVGGVLEPPLLQRPLRVRSGLRSRLLAGRRAQRLPRPRHSDAVRGAHRRSRRRRGGRGRAGGTPHRRAAGAWGAGSASSIRANRPGRCAAATSRCCSGDSPTWKPSGAPSCAGAFRTWSTKVAVSTARAK